MSEEEFRKIAKEYAEMYFTKGMDSTKIFKYVDELEKKVEQLEKENKELNLELSGYRQAILNDDNLMGLKLKIDKAITYIKTGKTFENKNTKKVVDTIQNDLLNILNKGSEE